jgi:hypothetical protein
LQEILQAYDWHAMRSELYMVGCFLIAMPLIGLWLLGSSRMAAKPVEARRMQRPRMTRHLGKDGLPTSFGRHAACSNALARAIGNPELSNKSTDASKRKS